MRVRCIRAGPTNNAYHHCHTAAAAAAAARTLAAAAAAADALMVAWPAGLDAIPAAPTEATVVPLMHAALIRVLNGHTSIALFISKNN